MRGYTIWARLFPRSGWDAYIPEGMFLQPGYGCVQVKRWRWWFFSPIGACAAHLYQSAPWERWGEKHERLLLLWLDIFDGISSWAARRLEKGSTTYRWNESLGAENEIGFHSPSDGSHQRSTIRWFSHPS